MLDPSSILQVPFSMADLSQPEKHLGSFPSDLLGGVALLEIVCRCWGGVWGLLYPGYHPLWLSLDVSALSSNSTAYLHVVLPAMTVMDGPSETVSQDLNQMSWCSLHSSKNLN